MKDKPIKIQLKELDKSSFYPITKLEVLEEQKECVANNSFSMAQAYFHKEALFRGIYVADEPVGFVMLNIDHTKPEYYLWRFMIDKNQQGKGYGKLALDEIVEYVKQFPKAKVLTSGVNMGKASPLEFYKKYGFTETEKREDGERVIKLELR